METNEKSKNKGRIATVLLALAILALAVSAFIPTLIKDRPVAVASASVDPDAVRVLNGCSAYAASRDFSTELTGAVKARVMGLPYTQRITGTRTVGGGDFSHTAESVSAFVKAAFRRERKNGVYTVSHGAYKNKAFDYSAPTVLNEGDYIGAYGQPYVGIVKYELENSIVAAEKIDDATYRYVLDPTRATVHCRNEVRSTLDSSDPKYSTVEFTLTVNGERPVKIVSCEKFEIDKFGGTSCTAEYTEVFTFQAE